MHVFIDGWNADISTELLHKCRAYNKRIEAIKEVRECFRSHDLMHNYVYTNTISLKSAKDFCDSILNMAQESFDNLLVGLGETKEVVNLSSTEAREIRAHVEKLGEEINLLKSYLGTILGRLEREE